MALSILKTEPRAKATVHRVVTDQPVVSAAIALNVPKATSARMTAKAIVRTVAHAVTTPAKLG